MSQQTLAEREQWVRMADEMPDPQAGNLRCGFRAGDGAVDLSNTFDMTASALHRSVDMYGIEAFPNVVWSILS